MHSSVLVYTLMFFFFLTVCVVKAKEGKERKGRCSKLDACTKCTHFLISHIGQTAAPQESNNGLVITPRKDTKELLTRNSSDLLLKNMPTSLYNLCQIVQMVCQKSAGESKLAPHLFTPTANVDSLLAKPTWRSLYMTKHGHVTQCVMAVCIQALSPRRQN